MISYKYHTYAGEVDTDIAWLNIPLHRIQDTTMIQVSGCWIAVKKSTISHFHFFVLQTEGHWSSRLARSNCCQQLTLSVCLSLTFLHIASSFFVSLWNRAIFWPSVLHIPPYKTAFFDFLFRPPNTQNSLPQICTKSPISRLVWQIDRRCLGLPGGFRG